MTNAHHLQFVKRHIARAISNNFPVQNICLSIAYGSGVFRQSEQTHDDNSKMIDLIFAVDSSYKFHTENMTRNPGHYASIMRCMGAERAASVQKNFGAKIYYHPFVELLDRENPGRVREYKYGVIDVQDLIEDLEQWTTLYCAGRLHKPVLFFDQSGIMRCASSGGGGIDGGGGGGEEIYNPEHKVMNVADDFGLLNLDLCEMSKDFGNGGGDNDGNPEYERRFLKAQQYNLQSALKTALLLLPERFSQLQLYETITSLSYMGDVRMQMGSIGEDVHKVSKIVHNNADYFDSMYTPLLERMVKEEKTHLSKVDAEDQSSDLWSQDLSDDARVRLLLDLPANLQLHMQTIYRSQHQSKSRDSADGTTMPETEMAKLIVRDTTLERQRKLIAKSLSNIVRQTSLEQTLKGVLTAGIGKSVRYAREKFSKSLTSKKE